MIRNFIRRTITLALIVALPMTAHGQQTPAPVARPATPIPSTPLELSGVLYPQFIYGGSRGNRSDNRFELERAYLTVRGKVSDRTSIRLTGDVFRPTPAASYTMRAKYAYAQYDYWTNNEGFMGTNAQTRIGMQQTLIIDQIEQYWPRWVAQSAPERAGFFSSSDLGISTTVAFGSAELFGMVSNGSGYTTPESDRFKDYSLRVSVTPFGQGSGLQGLTISPWLYKGARESAIRPDEGRKKDRAGVFAGYKSPNVPVPNVVIGGEYEVATNENEAGTPATLTTSDQSGTVISLYTHLRPFGMMYTNGNRAWGILLRWDRIEGDDTFVPSGGAFPVRDGTFVVMGVTYDLNSRLSWALDYQQQSPSGQFAPALDLRTYNLHVAAYF